MGCRNRDELARTVDTPLAARYIVAMQPFALSPKPAAQAAPPITEETPPAPIMPRSVWRSAARIIYFVVARADNGNAIVTGHALGDGRIEHHVVVLERDLSWRDRLRAAWRALWQGQRSADLVYDTGALRTLARDLTKKLPAP